MVPSSLEILINVVCGEENPTVSNAALQCNKSILPSSSSHENESHETTGVDNCDPYRPTQSSCVWWGGDSGSCVFVEDFKQLILDSSISGFVIDAYTTILMWEQLNRRFELQNKGTQMANESSYAFKSSCLQLIVRKSPEEWLELLKKWLPKACGFRYLHFPIHKGHHWTLLVLDTEWRSWKFHNSCLRTGLDHYCEVAEQLKKQVQNYLKSTLDGLVTILNWATNRAKHGMSTKRT